MDHKVLLTSNTFSIVLFDNIVVDSRNNLPRTNANMSKSKKIASYSMLYKRKRVISNKRRKFLLILRHDALYGWYIKLCY